MCRPDTFSDMFYPRNNHLDYNQEEIVSIVVVVVVVTIVVIRFYFRFMFPQVIPFYLFICAGIQGDSLECD